MTRKFTGGSTALIVLTLLALALSGCDQVKSAVAPKKPIGTCLVEAIQFYAGGGDVYNDNSCNVATGRNNNGNIWINASDVYKEYNRTMSVWMPPNWLNTESSGYNKIIDEYNSFLGCFQDNSDAKNQNPLQKQAPVDNGCSQYSLTVNDVPGVAYENKRFAPHFYFQALQKQ